MAVEVSEDPTHEDWGTFNRDTETITISVMGNPDPERILFHECVHAAIGFSGLTEILSGEQEEAIVRALEFGLYPAYIRNK